MALKKKGLGRGLDALLSDNRIEDAEGASPAGITVLRAADIEPNPSQARRHFDREALEELAESIKQHGLLQPLTVRRKENGFYEIIAGERRWRACKIAGISEIPAVVKEADDRTAAELSLIENLQREDLNPVEEANGYRALVEGFGLTQEQAAERVGKSRAAVANSMRILKLPAAVLSMVEAGTLSFGHARTLLPLCGVLTDAALAEKAAAIAENGASVRETERIVKAALEEKPKEEKKAPSPVEDSYYKRLESRISETLGRHASISRRDGGKGTLVLSYSGTGDLETLIKSICGNNIFDEEI